MYICGGNISRGICKGGDHIGRNIGGRAIWAGDVWVRNMYRAAVSRRGKYGGEVFGREIYRLHLDIEIQCGSGNLD